MTENDRKWPQMTANDRKWPHMTAYDQKWLQMTKLTVIESKWLEMTNDCKLLQITANDKNWLEMNRMIRNEQSLHFVGMHADCKALYAWLYVSMLVMQNRKVGMLEDVNIPTDNHSCTQERIH